MTQGPAISNSLPVPTVTSRIEKACDMITLTNSDKGHLLKPLYVRVGNGCQASKIWQEGFAAKTGVCLEGNPLNRMMPVSGYCELGAAGVLDLTTQESRSSEKTRSD